MDDHTIEIVKPADVNVIIGQAHFIRRSCLQRSLLGARSEVRRGFLRGVGPVPYRRAGTDAELEDLAGARGQSIGAGHVSVIKARRRLSD